MNLIKASSDSALENCMELFFHTYILDNLIHEDTKNILFDHVLVIKKQCFPKVEYKCIDLDCNSQGQK